MRSSSKEQNNKKAWSRKLWLACLMGAILAAGILWSDASYALRVSMKRIIFEGPKRSDIITIINNGAKEQTYRLGLRHYRMEEKRSLVNVDGKEDVDDDFKWADKMITYAPRRVTVPAGGSQQIRILLRRPRNLEEGEYRSHLWIVTELDTEKFNPDATKTKRSVQLTMQPGITMPIFVRHGKLSAKAKITDAKLNQTEKGLEVGFHLHREGNRSLYGDLRVTCTASGSEYEASFSRGIAIYTEVNKRIFSYDMNIPEDQKNNCRRVLIEYIADKDDSQYAGEVMAQASASLK